jgi:hypothetical protein
MGLEQVQPTLLTQRGEHPQVQRIGVASQTAVAGQKASERYPLSVGKQRYHGHH